MLINFAVWYYMHLFCKQNSVLYILHCKIQIQYNIKKDSMAPMQYPVDVCGTGTRWYTLYSPQFLTLMFNVFEQLPYKPTIQAVRLTSPSSLVGKVPELFFFYKIDCIVYHENQISNLLNSCQLIFVYTFYRHYNKNNLKIAMSQFITDLMNNTTPK